jgi:hypothetical protein
VAERWEYLVEDLPQPLAAGEGAAERRRLLNNRGGEGWELVAVYPANAWSFVFKRPAPDVAAPASGQTLRGAAHAGPGGR